MVTRNKRVTRILLREEKRLESKVLYFFVEKCIEQESVEQTVW